MLHRFLCLSIAFVLSAPVLPAQFWVKKDYHNWSQKECREMLRESPWAAERRLGSVVFDSIGASATGGDPTVEGREQPHVTYRGFFISAKPIRQAMMRLQELDPKFAKMEPAEQKQFAERAQKFLDQDFSEHIVIQVAYTTVPAYSLPLARHWQQQAPAELRRNFILVGAAGRIEASQVNVAVGGQGAGGEFQLIFPRKLKDVEMVGPDTKQIGLEFHHPDLPELHRAIPGERLFMSFHTKKMSVDGQVAY